MPRRIKLQFLISMIFNRNIHFFDDVFYAASILNKYDI